MHFQDSIYLSQAGRKNLVVYATETYNIFSKSIKIICKHSLKNKAAWSH